MRDLLPIHRAIELVEAHLQDDVTVAEMAAAAGYSLYHFIRIFDRVVYHTPYDYLMRRRLSEAAHEVMFSNRRVVDIALDYRFGNHETFSRAFKRLFGMQPVQWREQGTIPHHVLMPPISLAYLEHIHQPGFQRPEIIDRTSCQIAGLMAPFTGSPETIDRLWSSLGKQVERLFQARNPASFLGITTYLEGKPEDIFYLAAIDVSASEIISPWLVSQILPAGKYVRMMHCGPAATLPFTLDYLYYTWLPKAGLRPAYSMEIMAFGSVRPWVETDPNLTILLPIA